MAFGQIDPARLDGDALRRWYLRSPAEIEVERRQAADRAYQAFFSPRDVDAATAIPSGADRHSAGWPQVGGNGWRAYPSSSGREEHFKSSQRGPETYQLAAASPSDFWEDWTPCTSGQCHRGRLPPPPYEENFPFPPTYSPRSGGGSGGSDGSARPRGEWSERPQCNQQFEADREVCQKARDYRCWRNQNRRLSHCSLEGEVGIPRLSFGGR